MMESQSMVHFMLNSSISVGTAITIVDPLGTAYPSNIGRASTAIWLKIDIINIIICLLNPLDAAIGDIIVILEYLLNGCKILGA